MVWIHRDPAGKACVQMLESIWPHLAQHQKEGQEDELCLRGVPPPAHVI